MSPQELSSHDQVLRKEFSGHKYILSSIGILQIVVGILFLVGPIISLSAEVCSKYALWLELTFPIITVLNGVLLIIFYVICILGLSKRNTIVWIKIDLIASFFYAVSTLVLSILLLANCSNQGALSIIPGAIGIVGSLLLFIKSALLFVKWQNTKEETVQAPVVREAVDIKRKSIFI